MESSANPLRSLPSVDRILAHPRLAATASGPLRSAAAREAIASAREALRAGGLSPSIDAVAADAAAILARLERPAPHAVINATGVILHTNLGRAPLSDAALEAMQAAGISYSNLEYDLQAGERGSRFGHLEDPLRRLTGAAAGIAVNNNAAAMVLLLAALCHGREVIVSRSQAVEIGGGFRIPDVLRQSGATLVEVGTTNRTYLHDFEQAITDRTAAFLRVHASNFRVIGFTAFPELAGLAQLAHSRDLLLLDDLGSGCLLDTRRFGMLPEPTVQESVAAGVDVVAFSGDKLLGGPQAGILVGGEQPIGVLRKHPLARALRMDKLGIAALSATLHHYLRGDELTDIPVWRMIATPLAELEARLVMWRTAVGSSAEIVPGRSMIGGGSLPGEGVETRLLCIHVRAANAAASLLRRGAPPVIARVEDGCVVLDPRTVHPREDAAVVKALQCVAGTEL